MVARARNSETTLLKKAFSEGFEKYRNNLKKEAAAMKVRLKGTMKYLSIKYSERPEQNEDGSMKLDDFGMQIKTLMKSVAPPYRNAARHAIKGDRKRRKIANRNKARLRRA